MNFIVRPKRENSSFIAFLSQYTNKSLNWKMFQNILILILFLIEFKKIILVN
jgi:hypothetical protein